jgi:hypothetical protein
MSMRTLWVLLLVCTLTGCDPEDNWFQIGRPNDSKLTVGLAVAPADVAEKVVLVFHGIEFQPESGQPIRLAFDVLLPIDLLTLQDSRKQLFDKVDLRPGRYLGVRILARGDNRGLESYVVPVGETETLPLLLSDDAPLEIGVDFTMPDRGTLDLTLVFDLQRGLTGSSSQGAFVLWPDFRLVDTINTGGVAGTVDQQFFSRDCDPGGNAVHVFSGTWNNLNNADENLFLITAVRIPAGEKSGHYQLGFLPSGRYTLAFTCQADRSDIRFADLLLHREIKAGSVTQADFTR